MLIEFLATCFFWRIAPADMKNVPQEDYILMSAWCQVLVDGICHLIDGFSGQAGKAVRDASRQLPPEIRNKIPKMDAPIGSPQQVYTEKNKESSDSLSPQDKKTHRGEGPMQILKNPQVAKGVRSVYADYRFRQYEKKGFINECIQQRNERLGFSE